MAKISELPGRFNTQITRIIPLEQIEHYKRATKALRPDAAFNTIAKPGKRARHMSGQMTELEGDCAQVRVRFTSMQRRNRFEYVVASLKDKA